MADDKIIQFPKNRIVNDRTRELDAQRKKMGEKGKLINTIRGVGYRFQPNET